MKISLEWKWVIAVNNEKNMINEKCYWNGKLDFVTRKLFFLTSLFAMTLAELCAFFN